MVNERQIASLVHLGKRGDFPHYNPHTELILLRFALSIMTLSTVHEMRKSSF